MNDNSLKRVIEAEDNWEESASPDKDTFKRVIIADTEEKTDETTPINKTIRDFIHKKSKIKDFFSDNLMLCLISLISAAVVVAVFFFIGSIQHKDQQVIDSKYAELKEKNNKYNTIISDIDLLATEIDTLTVERDRMKGETDALKEYEAKAPEIEAQIAALQEELDSCNADTASKQAEINTLTGSISTKTASIVNLPSGIYTVGENITAGIYSVTGSGKILISNSRGGVKTNTILTADGISVTLDDGDKIQLDTRANFTPVSAIATPTEQPKTGGN